MPNRENCKKNKEKKGVAKKKRETESVGCGES